jgi:hypothetical protein
MKTAIYIEDGVVQLVLTPQNEFEKDALGSFHERKLDLEVRILSGSFYDYQGGYTRQNWLSDTDYGLAEDRSLILRANIKNNE